MEELNKTEVLMEDVDDVGLSLVYVRGDDIYGDGFRNEYSDVIEADTEEELIEKTVSMARSAQWDFKVDGLEGAKNYISLMKKICISIYLARQESKIEKLKRLNIEDQTWINNIPIETERRRGNILKREDEIKLLKKDQEVTWSTLQTMLLSASAVKESLAANRS